MESGRANEKMDEVPALTNRERIFLLPGLERNVLAASAAVFLLFLGEELWKKFLPRYLEALGAGAVTIGLFGTAKDFFDAIYQYPALGFLLFLRALRLFVVLFFFLKAIAWSRSGFGRRMHSLPGSHSWSHRLNGRRGRNCQR